MPRFEPAWGLAVEASQVVVSEWVAIEIDLETTQQPVAVQETARVE